MADLTVNASKNFFGPWRELVYDVGANLEVFAGQFMVTGAGGIVNSTAAAGDGVGFALEHVNNLTGSPNGGAARAASARIAVEGTIELLVANGAAFTHDDVGLPVYSIDGNSFTTTASANSKVGVILQCDAAVASGGNTETVIVHFNMALAHLLA